MSTPAFSVAPPTATGKVAPPPARAASTPGATSATPSRAASAARPSTRAPASSSTPAAATSRVMRATNAGAACASLASTPAEEASTTRFEGCACFTSPASSTPTMPAPTMSTVGAAAIAARVAASEALYSAREAVEGHAAVLRVPHAITKKSKVSVTGEPPPTGAYVSVPAAASAPVAHPCTKQEGEFGANTLANGYHSASSKPSTTIARTVPKVVSKRSLGSTTVTRRPPAAQALAAVTPAYEPPTITTCFKVWELIAEITRPGRVNQ